ncbi:MAG: amino acid permease [Planctomycetes bacterium]|nr:amino acid permease [Planctomycetota bacterium]
MPTAAAATPPTQRRTGTLGTFGGVFTPSILTILGIILFMRLGFVVGSAGLPRALAIILVANGVSILTSTSLAAVATNIRVKGGGDYYIISRTLGVEFGGPLGVVLYLAQSISVAFYAIGFAEAVIDMSGGAPWTTPYIALGAVLVLFVFAWIGADAATKLQYLIMVSLGLALVAVFVGGFEHFDGARFSGNMNASGDLPFWTVFAIFFPAVTGFTQGVAMSGDLANPSQSITRGTFAAVFLSATIYVVLALVLAGSVDGPRLVSDYGVLRDVASSAWLVNLGVVAATLSSALASLMGAPRILQSLARDRVFPGLKPFAQGHGESSNPRRGILLSLGLAIATISLGDLNVVAPVVSMFFLISYGLLNYATYAEARGNSPSFRPRFRWFDRRLSLIGCIGCLGAMVAINPTAAAISIVVLFALHQYLSNRTTGMARWADSSRGHRLATVRQQLLLSRSGIEHARDWRPVILAFSDDPQRRQRILRFASWIEAGTGFTTVVRLLAGDDPRTRKARGQAETDLRAEIERGGFDAFALVAAMPDLDTGFPTLVQAHGLGPIRANMILLNWFDGDVLEDARLRSYGRPLRAALRLQRSVVILEATEDELLAIDARPKRERRIDVWFLGDATSRLMILLAHLMTRHDDWEDSDVRLLAPLVEGQDRAALTAELEATLEDWRVDMHVEVVETWDHASVVSISGDAGAVLLPLAMRGETPSCPFSDDLEGLLDELPLTALVLAAQDIDLEAEPESGVYAERVAAEETADEKERRSTLVGKEAERSAAAAAEAVARLEAAVAKGVDEEKLAELRRVVEESAEVAERDRRRALKAQVVAESAERESAEISGEHLPEAEKVEPEPEAEPEAEAEAEADADADADERTSTDGPSTASS